MLMDRKRKRFGQTSRFREQRKDAHVKNHLKDKRFEIVID
jgi:hypothetical protein